MANGLIQDASGNNSSGRVGGFGLILFGITVGIIGLFSPGVNVVLVMQLFNTAVLTGSVLIGGSKAIEKIPNLKFG